MKLGKAFGFEETNRKQMRRERALARFTVRDRRPDEDLNDYVAYCDRKSQELKVLKNAR